MYIIIASSIMGGIGDVGNDSSDGDVFVALRGLPETILADMGTQITHVSLNTAVEGTERPKFAWREIREKTSSSGITWKHCPVQAQWRDGRSEAMVKALKRGLKLLNPGKDLTYAEVACLVAKAANVINERPLGFRHHGSGTPDICVITPNLLLKGTRTCAAEEHQDNFSKEMANLNARLAYTERCFEEWWHLWQATVWAGLVPFRKWKTDERNVRPDDIVLIRYEKKFSKPGFRMGKVLRVSFDEKQRVRTVVVGARPRSKRDGDRKYISKTLEEITLPVQRLIVLLAAEDRDKLPAANEELHICDIEHRVASLPGGHIPSTESVEKTRQDFRHAEECDGVPMGEASRLAVHLRSVQTSPAPCWQCQTIRVASRSISTSTVSRVQRK